MIPDASTGDVERPARWITVLFHLDDEQDEGPMGHSTSAVLDMYKALTPVIDGRPPPTSHATPPPIVAAVADLWAATAAGMSELWRHRFRDHLHRHPDAFLTQIEHRRQGSTPTPEEYPALRRDADGAPPAPPPSSESPRRPCGVRERADARRQRISADRPSRASVGRGTRRRGRPGPAPLLGRLSPVTSVGVGAPIQMLQWVVGGSPRGSRSGSPRWSCRAEWRARTISPCRANTSV
ncbi:terpene synthase family protein [Nonomuraea sp. NPDC050451]|uniref:terpene synthase family protein n=1 Tax=Nonomuraea sp. NPDC050451 TaxID=3364364 RepID=UPI00378D440E